MSELEKVGPLDDNWLMDRFKASCEEDKDIFDEGISVSESNVEEDEQDENDDNYDFLPKTEFEKSLVKIDNMTRQIDEDTQFLSHDLKTLQSKNESTERRILKLLKEAEEFKHKLRALNLKHSYSGGRHVVEKQEGSLVQESMVPPSSPSYQATLHVLLKQNSIEKPVHVNIAVRCSHSKEKIDFN